ncbi:DNA sulfur modification protein DndB [Tumebacillus permanentifrigoris]|uniref:DNA sulfur modification protein DndB n=1 Tax=Tumebacillus permanentifrigoris TaxID=378543 RepID=A0A316DE70_9BACL|nr:DNA sulfur modification protein DndB [Tumebacillus permanentifrigoris]PWK16501.1 DNA sulfur modification protein DndB [Tumebacillus permanentifrigoris]
MFGQSKPIGLSIPATEGVQFGKRVVSLQCKVEDILKIYGLDKSVQRQLDKDRVSGIARYIQYGLEGNDIYFSPILFSARCVGEFSDEQSAYIINMSDQLFLLDGQHRISAFEELKRQLLEGIDENPDNGELLGRLMSFPLSVQIYRDLNQDQERQLFTDINRNSLRVHKTLGVLYRSNDLYSTMVREIIDSHPTIPSNLFETRAKYTRKKLMTAATLYDMAQMLNEGFVDKRKGIKKGNYNRYKSRTEAFLSSFFRYSPKDASDREKYIVWQAKTIVAIAKFVYEVREENQSIKVDHLFRDVVHQVDWTYHNQEFLNVAAKYNKQTKRYTLGSTARVHKLLSEYLVQKFNERRLS